MIEPALKIALVPVGITAELFWAHSTGYRPVHCPAGTARAGKVIGNHINNWQHVSMYPAFAASGIADFVAAYVDLPPGADKALLGMAYLIEAMLMGLHKKHTPLDIAEHELLYYAMLATAIAVFMEVKLPRSFSASFMRAAAQQIQGMWFLVLAHMGWGGKVAWSETMKFPGDDMAPTLATPIVFLKVTVLILLAMCGVWCIMYCLYRPDLAQAERARAEGSGERAVVHKPSTCDEDGQFSLVGAVASAVTVVALVASIPFMIGIACAN